VKHQLWWWTWATALFCWPMFPNNLLFWSTDAGHCWIWSIITASNENNLLLGSPPLWSLMHIVIRFGSWLTSLQQGSFLPYHWPNRTSCRAAYRGFRWQRRCGLNGMMLVDRKWVLNVAWSVEITRWCPQWKKFRFKIHHQLISIYLSIYICNYILYVIIIIKYSLLRRSHSELSTT